MTTSKLLSSALACLATTIAIAACTADSPEDVVPAADSGTSVIPDAGTSDTGSDGGTPDGGGAKCGNGKIEPGETCDDGNTAPGDGCSTTCAIESAFEGDICPGKPMKLTASGTSLTATVTGTTKGAFNHYGSACGGGSAPDVVHTFTPPSSGKATIKLTANYSAILSARSTCTSATSEIKCGEITSASGGSTTMEIPVFAATPVSVFVDGYAGSAGDYTIELSITNAVCGNGVAELPETCDDGNKAAGDGCSATCTLEAGGVLDACPGQPFFLTGAAGAVRKISLSGNTKTKGADNQGATGCFFHGGVNAVYALKSDVTGSLKANLTTGYSKAALHARTDCASTSFQVGCAMTLEPGVAKLDVPVKANEWLYLFVDSDDDGGPYTLDVAVTPAACGNDVLDGDEQCDDGNAVAGDGCTAACALEPLTGVDTCPGHALTLAAQPDGSRTAVVSGNTTGLANDVVACQSLASGTNAPDAIFAVTPDIDGALQLDLIASFQGTVSVIDRCSAPLGERTTVLACSYGPWVPPIGQDDPWVLDGMGSGPKSVRAPVVAGKTYWVVVDGSVSSSNAPSASSGPFELRMKLTAPVCGNGIVEGAETCDDGGTDGNDGCSATCQLEPATTRDTCANADDVTFADLGGGTWSANIKSGTTNLKSDQNFGSSKTQAGVCWARGRDAFFKVTAPAAGVLRATARSTAFDVILGLRSPTCAMNTVPTSCSNDGPKGVDERVSTVVAAGEVVYLVVDTPLLDVNGCTDPISATLAADCAKLEEQGRFALDVKIEPSGCGDGFFVPTATEECDDGNAVAGDGCSVACKIEPKAGADTCPGTPLAFSGAGSTRSGTITLSTATMNANYTGACGGNAKDGVVDVVAPISGQLRAKVRNMAGATVYARTTCIDPSTELLKTSGSTCPSVVHDVVTFSVTAGSHYYLFVDGLDGATGVPTLDVTIGP